MTWRPALTRRPSLLIAPPCLALAVLGAGCSRLADPRAGGPPAMPVEAVTLAEQPVEQTTEFVGTVKSRRSTIVQPQVEGFVTRILVRSGDRVRPGAPLMQIDSRMQQAAVASLESLRAGREADLRLRAAGGRAHQDARRGRRGQPLGAGAGARPHSPRPRPSSRRSRSRCASRAWRSGTTGDRADGRRRGRHPGARRRPRDQLHRAHDDRRERRARGLRQRAGAGGAST